MKKLTIDGADYMYKELPLMKNDSNDGITNRYTLYHPLWMNLVTMVLIKYVDGSFELIEGTGGTIKTSLEASKVCFASHSKGKWEIQENEILGEKAILVRDVWNESKGIFKHKVVCTFPDVRGDAFTRLDSLEAETNMELIKEAGKVSNETGLTPRELLSLKNDLVDKYKESCDMFASIAEEVMRLETEKILLVSALKVASLHVSSISNKEEWSVINQAIQLAEYNPQPINEGDKQSTREKALLWFANYVHHGFTYLAHSNIVHYELLKVADIEKLYLKFGRDVNTHKQESTQTN